MEQEIWKDIPGYEGLYQASSLGRVKSFRNGAYGLGADKILKLNKCNVYLKARLYKDKVSKDYSVHRLVLSGFKGLDLTNPKIYGLHIKEDLVNGLLDNSLSNLFIGTHSDNILDRNKKNRANLRKGKTHHKSKPIGQYLKNGVEIRKWESRTMAEKELGIKNIWMCVNGKRKTAGGFIWKFIN